MTIRKTLVLKKYWYIINNVRRKLIVAILLSAVILVTSLSMGISVAQEENGRYFEETGHWVSGDFYESYTSVTDPEIIFGDPITEPFPDPTTTRRVQYFERAHFEIRPENPPELRVHWSLLGEYLYERGQEIPIPPNFPACETYIETGYQICYAFLDFFKLNGGVAQFGYPISDVEVREGRIVQWFQRARLEWHPEMAPGERVMLARLGEEYFVAHKEDTRRLLPAESGNLPRVITRLDVRGFFIDAVVPARGSQTIYVIVQDQKLEPVGKAQLIATIRYPSGYEISTDMEATDENGISSLTFPVHQHELGIVEVFITASYDSLEEMTRTSFRIWW